MEKTGNIVSRNKGKIALIAGLGSVVALGPKAWDAAGDWIHPESMVVKGVTAQVESHSIGSHCGLFIKNLCYRRDPNFYLNIEQCPADIAAAEAGRQTTSVDPKVGERSPACFLDSVEVDLNTWQTIPDGTMMSFGGPVGEHLRK